MVFKFKKKKVVMFKWPIISLILDLDILLLKTMHVTWYFVNLELEHN